MATRERSSLGGDASVPGTIFVGASRVSSLVRLGELGSMLAEPDGADEVLREALAVVKDLAEAQGAAIVIRPGSGAEPRFVAHGDCAAHGHPIEMTGLDGEPVGTLTLYFDDPNRTAAEPQMVGACVRRLAEILERTRLSGDKRQLVARERRRSEQLRGLAEAALVLTTAPTVGEVLRRLNESAQAIIGTHQAVATRLWDGRTNAETYVLLSDKYATYRSYDEDPQWRGLVEWVTTKNRPLRLTAAEMADHPDFLGLANVPGHPPLPNYLAAPLLGRDGHALGLIQLSDKIDGTDFTKEDESILVQMAQTASTAIETIEAMDRERAARRDAERTSADLTDSLDKRGHYERVLAEQARIFEAIAKGEPHERLLEMIVRAIEALSPGTITSILLLDGNTLRHGPAPGLPGFYTDAINGITIGPDVGSCGSAAWHRRPVVVTDIATDHRWEAFRDLAARAKVRACWSTPIFSGEGDVLGTLAVYYPQPHTPDQSEERVVQVFAHTAAVAIERSRDIEELVREKRIVSTLNDVGRAIGARLDVNDIVQHVTDAATELTKAQFGAFFYNVFGPDGESYMLYALSGVPRAAFESFPMPRNTAIFEPTFRGQGTVISDDITADPRYGQSAPYHGMPPGHLPVRSYLAVPVSTVDGEVVGGLFFGHADRGVFGPDAAGVVEGIAAHAAIAIQNARLYETARRDGEAARAAFEDRDRVARVLQESLLPPNLPRIPGASVGARFRPGSSDVGGDFYDVFPVRGRDWGIVIGDVCGKGADAAALTALARHSIRTAAMLQRQPSRVLAIMNEALLRSDTDGRFVTAAFVRLTPSAHGAKLVLAGGGHPPMAVLRSWGDVMMVEGKGSLLGVFDDPGVEDQVVDLKAGDSLILYTDGVTEARRGDDLFGEQRLAETLRSCRGLSAEQIVERIERAVDEFQSDGTTDDLAVVAVTIDH